MGGKHQLVNNEWKKTQNPLLFSWEFCFRVFFQWLDSMNIQNWVFLGVRIFLFNKFGVELDGERMPNSQAKPWLQLGGYGNLKITTEDGSIPRKMDRSHGRWIDPTEDGSIPRRMDRSHGRWIDPTEDGSIPRKMDRSHGRWIDPIGRNHCKKTHAWFLLFVGFLRGPGVFQGEGVP